LDDGRTKVVKISLAHLELMRIRKNEVLFEKGQLESGGKFHILLDGKLALYTQPLSEMLNIEIGPENKREGILA
jgi:hypothetical protein